MIVPMKKYSFLVYHADYIKFLQDLQDLGVVHVIEKGSGEIQDEEVREKYNRLQAYKNIIGTLKKRKTESSVTINDDPEAILNQVKENLQNLESYGQKLSVLSKESATLEPWGNFNWDDINKLKVINLHYRFFTCNLRTFDQQWAAQYNLEIINTVGTKIYFVIIHDSKQEIQINADEVSLPIKSLNELQTELRETELLIKEAETRLDNIASGALPVLEDAFKKLVQEIDFAKVVLNTHKEAENKLMVLEGWVPSTNETKISDYLEKAGIYYQIDIPKPGDKVPVLLQNNRFAKLYEPIGKLFSLPNYFELDLTPLFAPFFMLFFGFCLGDAGYGIFLLILVTILKIRTKKTDIKSILTLAQWLGVSTIIMGFISGTFFGIPLLEIEGFTLKKYMLNSDQLFYLSMAIGLVQIIFGLCVKTVSLVKQKGIKYALSTIGWIFLFISMIVIVALDKYKILPPGLKPYLMYPVFGISGFLIFIYNDPDSNPLISSLKGIWDVYGMIGGVFGDTLSYIRLFALGTSGAILGFVINTIALQMLNVAYVGPLLFVIFLLFGHSLTIALSLLGAFVHPMRLTFVEFYKNAGFAGGGKEYKPFK